MKIYPYVNTTRANSDGSYPVYFIIKTKQGRFFVNTGITTCAKLVELSFPRSDRNWKQKTVLLGKYFAKVESLCLTKDVAELDNALLKERILKEVFERKVGMANASLSKTLENGKGIRSDSLENILSACPDLSAEWLLRGTGNMLVGGVVNDNEYDSKFKQFQDKVFRMSSNKEQMNMAYDIAMSALDLVGKTYDFFSKKGE